MSEDASSLLRSLVSVSHSSSMTVDEFVALVHTVHVIEDDEMSNMARRIRAVQADVEGRAVHADFWSARRCVVFVLDLHADEYDQRLR